MALSARVPQNPLTRLVAIVALILVTDLLIASAVLVDRLDDPDIPDFNRASVAQVRWDVSPYRDAPPLLGFPTRPEQPEPDAAPERELLYAITALSRFDQTQDQQWVRRARAAVGRVLDDTDGGLVAHRRDATDLLGRPVEAPWYAADAQGMLLSALARLEDVTGDSRLAAEADEVFRALRSFQGFFAGSRPAPEHWLSSVDRGGYLFFDQFSTGLSSSSVLTEQLWTALGVYDYRRTLADEPDERDLAEDMFAGTLATVRHYFDFWRVPGQISVSSLLAGNRDVRSHFVATRQLEILAGITDAPWTARAATQLDLDDNIPYFAFKPVQVRPAVPTYSPVPRAVEGLARTGRPERRARAGDPRPATSASDPLRRAAEALVLLSGPSDAGEVRRASDLVAQVLATARDGAVPHRSRLEDPAGRRVKPPWFSSASQGMLLSALAGLSDRTGDPRWRRDADRVFAALTRVRDYGEPTPAPWMGYIDFSGYLWFDQNLNGGSPRSIYEHVTALVGIYDYWRTTRSADAYAYLVGGLTTLRDARSLIRRRGGPAVESLAVGAGDRGYHDVITSQVETLAAVTRDEQLVRLAQRLREDYP